jgi:hypothetical protein
MTNSAGAVQNGLVLRMSVPASGALSHLSAELATRLGEQLGVSAPHVDKIAGAIAELTTRVGASGSANVEFELHKLASSLKIVARHDEHSAETRIPLNA